MPFLLAKVAAAAFISNQHFPLGLGPATASLPLLAALGPSTRYAPLALYSSGSSVLCEFDNGTARLSGWGGGDTGDTSSMSTVAVFEAYVELAPRDNGALLIGAEGEGITTRTCLCTCLYILMRYYVTPSTSDKGEAA